ncbi:MAG: AAA family ATPase, partial [Actinomycetota bacterium]
MSPSEQPPVQRPAVYVGVGIGSYDDTDNFKSLPRAIPDVHDIGKVVASFGYIPHFRDDLKTTDYWLPKVLPQNSFPSGGSILLVWAGHAEPTPERKLQLIAKDTISGSQPDLTPDYIASVVARTGASQILLIFDTCYSGQATGQAGDIAEQVIAAIPPAAKDVWVGVLASAGDLEQAKDGVFGRRLLDLLRHGPTDPVQRRRWSANNVGIYGTDLTDALTREWDEPGQRPKSDSRGGVALELFPNPRREPGGEQKIQEQLLVSARGAEPEDERSYFTGRVKALNQIVTWLKERRPGVFVLTGPAGSGKSAIVGRLVSLSNTGERVRLLEAGPLDSADPGEESVDVELHARGLTAKQVAQTIDDQLTRRGMLSPKTSRKQGELFGALAHADSVPVIALDGLDEAGTEAWRIVDDIVRPHSGGAQIVVGTRNLPAATGNESLLERLGGTELLDLGLPALRDETEQDVHAYVELRLRGKAAPDMDATEVARAISSLSPEQGEGLF